MKHAQDYKVRHIFFFFFLKALHAENTVVMIQNGIRMTDVKLTKNGTPRKNKKNE